MKLVYPFSISNLFRLKANSRRIWRLRKCWHQYIINSGIGQWKPSKIIYCICIHTSEVTTYINFLPNWRKIHRDFWRAWSHFTVTISRSSISAESKSFRNWCCCQAVYEMLMQAYTVFSCMYSWIHINSSVLSKRTELMAHSDLDFCPLTIKI